MLAHGIATNVRVQDATGFFLAVRGKMAVPTASLRDRLMEAGLVAPPPDAPDAPDAPKRGGGSVMLKPVHGFLYPSEFKIAVRGILKTEPGQQLTKKSVDGVLALVSKSFKSMVTERVNDAKDDREAWRTGILKLNSLWEEQIKSVVDGFPRDALLAMVRRIAHKWSGALLLTPASFQGVLDESAKVDETSESLHRSYVHGFILSLRGSYENGFISNDSNLHQAMWNAVFLCATYGAELNEAMLASITAHINKNRIPPFELTDVAQQANVMHARLSQGLSVVVVSLLIHGTSLHPSGGFTLAKALHDNVQELELLGWPGHLSYPDHSKRDLCDGDYSFLRMGSNSLHPILAKARVIDARTVMTDIIPVVKLKPWGQDPGNPLAGLYFDRALKWLKDGLCNFKVCDNDMAGDGLDEAFKVFIKGENLTLSGFVDMVGGYCKDQLDRKAVIRVVTCFAGGRPAPPQRFEGEEVKRFMEVYGAQSMLTHAQQLCVAARDALWFQLWDGTFGSDMPVPPGLDHDIFKHLVPVFLDIQALLAEDGVRAALEALMPDGRHNVYLYLQYSFQDFIGLKDVGELKGLQDSVRRLHCYSWMDDRPDVKAYKDGSKDKATDFEGVQDEIKALVALYIQVAEYIMWENRVTKDTERYQKARQVAEETVHEGLLRDIWNLAYATLALGLTSHYVADNIRNYIGTYNHATFDSQRPDIAQEVYQHIAAVYLYMHARMAAEVGLGKTGTSGGRAGGRAAWIASALCSLAVFLAVG